MAFVSIASSRYAPDAPCSTDLFADIVTDLNFLNSGGITVDSNGSPTVVNGSFEADNATGVVQAQGWSVAVGTGGTGATSTASQAHGGYSYLVTRDTTPGHNGAVLTSASFMNISPLQAYQLRFMLNRSRGDTRNLITINWYTQSQATNGSTTLLDTTTFANGNDAGTWLSYNVSFTPPAGSYYSKLVFDLGNSAATPGGTASIYLDGIAMSVRPPFQKFSSVTGNGSTFTIPAGTDKIKLWIVPSGSVLVGSAYTSLDVAVGDVFTYNSNQVTNSRTGTVYTLSGSNMQNTNTIPPMSLGVQGMIINY